jgi:XTP/dITP diphosphohydrolase
MIVVFATHNRDKFYELEQLFEVEGIEYIPAAVFDIDEIEETGKTFKENAILKARCVAEQTGYLAIGDDSGMELPALGGYPGLFSARCAGENATDEDRRQHILQKMAGIEDRRVSFVCALALVRPDDLDHPICFTGQCHGELLNEARGEADEGLQYDSLFYDLDLRKTFAEIPKEHKHLLSHRGRAANQMKTYLVEVMKSEGDRYEG